MKGNAPAERVDNSIEPSKLFVNPNLKGERDGGEESAFPRLCPLLHIWSSLHLVKDLASLAQKSQPCWRSGMKSCEWGLVVSRATGKKTPPFLGFQLCSSLKVQPRPMGRSRNVHNFNLDVQKKLLTSLMSPVPNSPPLLVGGNSNQQGMPPTHTHTQAGNLEKIPEASWSSPFSFTEIFMFYL